MKSNASEKTMAKVPTVDIAKTGKNIERMRKEAGMSVADLQKVFGFSTPMAIYKWQAGTNLPSVDNLLILSQLFNVAINDILVGKGSET